MSRESPHNETPYSIRETIACVFITALLSALKLPAISRVGPAPTAEILIDAILYSLIAALWLSHVRTFWYRKKKMINTQCQNNDADDVDDSEP